MDDEETFARLIRVQLEMRGYDVDVCHEPADVMALLAKEPPDAIVLDQGLPGTTGLALLRPIKEQDPSVTVVMLSGSIEVPHAVQAVRAGAEDVQLKPPDFELLCAALERGLARTALLRSRRLTETQVTDPYGFLDDSPAMRRVRRLIEGLSRSTIPALIVGEAGTGRHAVATMLHQLSPMASQPFVAVDCRAQPPDAVEHEIAALLRSGGDATTEGLLARVGGGTLFLSDIDVLSDGAQSLLFALLDPRVQERHQWIPSNVRVIASTRRDLAEEVHRGALRADLHKLMAIMPIIVPSLRERGPDAVRVLARRATARQQLAVGEGPARLTSAAETLLESIEWPGNVRQLHAVLEDAFVLALEFDAIDAMHVQEALDRRGIERGGERGTDDQSLRSMERLHIARVLDAANGNRTQAARQLGITRTTLYKKIAEYGLEDARER